LPGGSTPDGYESEAKPARPGHQVRTQFEFADLDAKGSCDEHQFASQAAAWPARV